MRLIQMSEMWDRSKKLFETEARAVIIYLQKNGMKPKRIHQNIVQISLLMQLWKSGQQYISGADTAQRMALIQVVQKPRPLINKLIPFAIWLQITEYLLLSQLLRPHLFGPHYFNWNLRYKQSVYLMESQGFWRESKSWKELTFPEEFWFASWLILRISSADQKLKMKYGFTISNLNHRFKENSEDILVLTFEYVQAGSICGKDYDFCFGGFLKRNHNKSKVGDCSRGWPESSLFDSYYTNVERRALLFSIDCSTLPLIRTL